ncbi:hypothetical protein E5288_WYG014872 [Bos mutus]|uniref:Uncharacterized protein n=1 Tax=Bos mutus TaxID=72004 RepID=A0A6B0S4T0_9CETA|nr:hypothetical protein [Bos mutus]
MRCREHQLRVKNNHRMWFWKKKKTQTSPVRFPVVCVDERYEEKRKRSPPASLPRPCAQPLQQMTRS